MPSNPKKQAAFYKPSGSASYKFPRHVQVEDGDADVAYVGKAFQILANIHVSVISDDTDGLIL